MKFHLIWQSISGYFILGYLLSFPSQNKASPSHLQVFWTCCSLYLQHSSLRFSQGWLLASFRSRFIKRLLWEAFRDCSFQKFPLFFLTVPQLVLFLIQNLYFILYCLPPPLKCKLNECRKLLHFIHSSIPHALNGTKSTIKGHKSFVS